MRPPTLHGAARAFVQLCTLRTLYTSSAFLPPPSLALLQRPSRPPYVVPQRSCWTHDRPMAPKGHGGQHSLPMGPMRKRSFMSLGRSGGGPLRGAGDEEDGGEKGVMEDEGELDLDGIDLSPEELAMLEKMFQESNRAKRKNLRKRNSEIRAKVEKKGKGPVAAQVKKPVAGPSTATTEDEAMAQVKTYRKVEAPKRMVELVSHCLSQGLMTDRILKAAVRSQMEMDRSDLAADILQHCHQQWPWEGVGVRGRVECARWYCRLGQTDEARKVAADLGLMGSEVQRDETTGALGPYGVGSEDAASLMMTLGKAAVKANDTSAAIRDLRHLVTRLKAPATMEFCNHLLHALSKRQQVDGLFQTLDLMREGKLHPDSDSYQFISTALVRSVEFVTGAVSMDTLPKRRLNEAVFIGRSNVGKSSLLNMVTARKDLAYVSKRPGKTQQFNYFIVNDNTRSAFYLVDVPGVGFAKVSLDQKAKWAAFFKDYMSSREGLRVIFHLVDSRHGPLDQDLATMEAMQGLREGVRYVVVLTKADKKDGKISPTVMQDVRTALETRGLGGTPVIVTSAVNKMGRDDMWRYLRLAVLPKAEDKRKE